MIGASLLVNFLGGPVVTGLLNAYKAKLAADNTSDRITADLAIRELAVEQREKEIAVEQMKVDEGRWWTAAPRAIVTWSFALYVAKIVVYDTMLGMGSTPPLHGDVSTWIGWLMAMWFGGRSAEKIAQILKKR